MLIAIAALLASQGQIKPPTYPEEAYLGGHLEEAIGLKPHGTIVFGQYISKATLPSPTELSGYVELNPKDSMAKTPVRVGFVGFKVSNSVLDGKPCVLFESDGSRNQVRQYRNDNGFDVINTTPIQRYRKVWLSPEGIPLREQSGFRNRSVTYEIEAVFKKEEIELTIGTPKGKRTRTIFPAEGVDSFANEFKPMVDGDKVLMKEKSFSRLDPLTGGIVQVKATVATRFEGTIFLKKFKGHRIDYKIGDRTEVAFISNTMDLLQVNVPFGESLLAENDPTDGKSDLPTKIKTGGGGG